MTVTIACTNFGDCLVADESSKPDGKTFWGERLVACPYCGKALASPHRVALDPIAGSVREGKSIRVVVSVGLGRTCSRSGELSLEIDGEQIGEAEHVAVEQKYCPFEIPGRDTGIYRIRAVLRTDDGRKTYSNEQLLLVAQPSNLIAPLLWALLLILLLCLSASLGWFGKPLFGWMPHPSLSYAVDGVSIVSALLIGGLLLDLGRRERTLGRESAGVTGQHRSLVRFQSYDQLSNEFPRSNSILQRAGETASSGAALIILGALPFCFAFAYLAGIVLGNQKPWPTLVAFAVAGIAIVAAFWRTELRGLSGKLLGRLPGGAVPPPPARAADSAIPTPEQSPVTTVTEVPSDGDLGPGKEKT